MGAYYTCTRDRTCRDVSRQEIEKATLQGHKIARQSNLEKDQRDREESSTGQEHGPGECGWENRVDYDIVQQLVDLQCKTYEG